MRLKKPLMTGHATSNLPGQGNFLISDHFYFKGHQCGARGHQFAHKDQVGRPRACSKNNINMINAFTLTNVNTKIIEGKLNKIFISEVYMKLVALRINRYARSSLQFQKGWWPLFYIIKQHIVNLIVQCCYCCKLEGNTDRLLEFSSVTYRTKLIWVIFLELLCQTTHWFENLLKHNTGEVVVQVKHWLSSFVYYKAIGLSGKK